MNKSSNVRNISVNEENSKKAASFGLDLKNIDLEEVLKLELSELMFRAGLSTVQRLIEAEVEKLASPRYSRGGDAHRWGLVVRRRTEDQHRKAQGDAQEVERRAPGGRAKNVQTILKTGCDEQSCDGENVGRSVDQRLRRHS
jgi:hypothetical protein